MKKISIFVLIFVGFSISTALFGQTTEATKNFTNLKKVESELDEETKIEIRKPDNASILARKNTNLETDMKLNVMDKFKKSNKLLY